MRAVRGSMALLVILSSTVGCGGTETKPAVPVTVMTRNLYLGADLNGLLFASTLDALQAQVSQIWQAVQASDFPARAELLADEIGAASPHLVGLQEVSLFRTQVPGDFTSGVTTPAATDVAIDFLALLTNALAARGLSYRVANEALNGDAELPVGGATDAPFDLRLTDRDVILAREDVQIAGPMSAHFAQNLTLPVGGSAGVSVTFLRGFSSVAATVDGARLTFVNSHLEIDALAFIQEPQATELSVALDSLPDPLVVVGDFNSAADGSKTTSYATLTKQLSDAYGVLHPGDPAKTCCNDADLRNPIFNGGERIDLVLSRGAVRAESAQVVGTDPAHRTASGLWPSDHAGVVATLGVTP